MKCPIDGSDLLISERSGVEVDYCPKCRGVWLDRGELDKIIERSNNQLAEQEKFYHDKYEKHDRYDDRKKYDDDYYKRKKKKSIFDDLFDF